MSSASLQLWNSIRAVSLDQIEAAHGSVGGSGRGRRYATQQINQAYTVLLSSQFQGFCRDLHSECVTILLQGIPSVPLRTVLNGMVLTGRKLDSGNPNPGNIGVDFGGFGFRFWDAVYAISVINRARKAHLDALNDWRNAVAHQDFTAPRLGGATVVQLVTVRRWRAACNGLATAFDAVMQDRLRTLIGTSPW